MNPIIKKLAIEKFQNILILNAPNEFKPVLNEISPTIETVIKGRYPYILSFEKEMETLIKNIPAQISALETNGQLWIAYPKGSSNTDS